MIDEPTQTWKHTPELTTRGEWLAEEDTAGGITITAYPLPTDEHQSPSSIADMNDVTGYAPGVQMANATGMAAWKDLLAALMDARTQMKGAWDGGLGGRPVFGDKNYLEMDAAIDKALGRGGQ